MLLLALPNPTTARSPSYWRVVLSGFLTRLSSQPLWYTIWVVACSSPAQVSRHILKRSSHQTLLRRLHGPLQRLDLILVRLDEVLDVDLAIGIRVPRWYRGNAVLRLHGEASAFHMQRTV